MKNIEQIKDDIAHENGFKDWGSDLHEQFICGKVGYIFIQKLHNEVTKRYAHQALDLAADSVELHVDQENPYRIDDYPEHQRECLGDGRDGDILAYIDRNSILKLKEKL